MNISSLWFSEIVMFCTGTPPALVQWDSHGLYRNSSSLWFSGIVRVSTGTPLVCVSGIVTVSTGTLLVCVSGIVRVSTGTLLVCVSGIVTVSRGGTFILCQCHSQGQCRNAPKVGTHHLICMCRQNTPHFQPPTTRIHLLFVIDENVTWIDRTSAMSQLSPVSYYDARNKIHTHKTFQTDSK